MASDLDKKFHCAKRTLRSAKKSKHGVSSKCQMLMSVLALNPSYGDQIPSFNTLRKMRIAVPEHKMGKSSGYRLIYAERVIEQTHRIVLLEVYFKGDVEDLAKAEYYTLGAEAEEIFGSVFEYDWVDGPAVPPIPK